MSYTVTLPPGVPALALAIVNTAVKVAYPALVAVKVTVPLSTDKLVGVKVLLAGEPEGVPARPELND